MQKSSLIEATSTLIRFRLKKETSYRKRIERFSSTLQQENGVFQCIHSGERFRKVLFSVTEDTGLVWTKGLTVSKSISVFKRKRISVDGA